jgi:hypothetical protein
VPLPVPLWPPVPPSSAVEQPAKVKAVTPASKLTARATRAFFIVMILGS